MQDDPFARAVARAEAAEQAERRSSLSGQTRSLAQRGLRVHAAVFVAVNVLLFAIWLTTWQLADGTSYPWFIWPLLGWGIGLVAHWAATPKRRT